MPNLTVILVLLAAIALVIFLIKRNRKDRHEFEDGVNRPDIRPEKHEEESEKI